MTNVIVKGEAGGDGDSWVGSFSCESGSLLVGEPRLKCRGGLWSGELPVCAGQCGLQGSVSDMFTRSVLSLCSSRK